MAGTEVRVSGGGGGGAAAPSGAAGGDLTGTFPDPTVGAGKITLAKMADIATARFIARLTAGTGVPESLTAAQAKAILAIAAGDVSGLAAIAASGSASDLGTGTLPIARIADGAITLAKQADMATARIRGRTTAGTGVPEDLTATQVKAILAIATGDVSGLAAVAASGSASDLAAGTLPIARIADGAVTLAKQADMATARIRGRTTAGTGVPEDLTAAQAAAIINPSLPLVGALTADVATSEGTTSTTYTDLATSGPAVTVTVGPSGIALVLFGGQQSNGTASNGCRTSVAIGAATATDGDSASMLNSASGGLGMSQKFSHHILVTGLTPGSVTFTMKYRASVGGTATFAARRITVIPL